MDLTVTSMGAAWDTSLQTPPRAPPSISQHLATLLQQTPRWPEQSSSEIHQAAPSIASTSRKTVEVCEPPSHKPTSEQFRRHSHNFEAGEFTKVKEEPEEDSSSDSDLEGSPKPPPIRAVRFVEVPGVGESSPNFRRKSHEFQRNEFTLSHPLPQIDSATTEEEAKTPANPNIPRPIRLHRERSKTTITKKDSVVVDGRLFPSRSVDKQL